MVEGLTVSPQLGPPSRVKEPSKKVPSWLKELTLELQ